jgi:hypothetical protein
MKKVLCNINKLLSSISNQRKLTSQSHDPNQELKRIQ